MKITEPNYNWAYGLTPRSTTTHLIIHHSAGNGTAEGIHEYHKSLGWAGIAYHYYIRKNGEIVRGRPENMRGGHTKGLNYCSIGICFEGNFDNEIMGETQFNSGKLLIKDIKSRYPGIEIGKHNSYNPTGCPGKNFPFDNILAEAEEPIDKDAESKTECDVWAKDSCEWAVKQGIFKGDGESFKWHDTLTRQELAVILERFYKLFL